METFIQAKTSAIKNQQAIDTLVSLKQKINLEELLTYFIKCLIQNSNYEEIISNVDYLDSLKLTLSDESICQLLMCFIDYDDWIYFKKYFLIYFDSQHMTETTIKKVISALVEKQSTELLKYVMSVTMKEKNIFMNLKLSENQYKFIILSLIKSHIDIAAKLTIQNPLLENKKERKSSDPEKIEHHHHESSLTSSMQVAPHYSVKSENEESDDFFEIIDEAMIDKIIKDIVASEKKTLK